MAQLNAANGVSAGVAKAIVMFGLDDDGKPHAGLFQERDAALAKKAARHLGLTALTLSAADLTAIGGKIAPGRLYANRRSFVPPVQRGVHEKLVEFAKSGGTGGSSGRGSTADGQPPTPPAGIPKDWDTIKTGDQVIAQASISDGWWEAIVVARDGEMLILKWRDAPREPHFRMHVAQVAIQQIQPAA